MSKFYTFHKINLYIQIFLESMIILITKKWGSKPKFYLEKKQYQEDLAKTKNNQRSQQQKFCLNFYVQKFTRNGRKNKIWEIHCNMLKTLIFTIEFLM